MEIRTDNHDPQNNRWELQEAQSSKIVWSYGPYETKHKVYYHSTCVTNDKTYLFAFYDDDGVFDGYYQLKVNDKVIKHFNEYFEKVWIKHKKTILCSKNEDFVILKTAVTFLLVTLKKTMHL